jgi:allophanate hydrolase subunit 1|tara:strand:- start:178 stop:468 length:291 start_codon:yes stop_codon:yes gene_type:complete
MAKTKKEEVIDLKPKAEKITEEQLKKVQDNVNGINKLQLELGMLETRKHAMLHNVAVFQENLAKLQDEFQVDYGTADINVQDGTINYKDEQADKKD